MQKEKNMITELTKEQEAKLEIYRDRWIAIGLSCEPCDLEKAIPAVHLAYKAAGLKPPERIVVADCPVTASIKAEILRQDISISDEELQAKAIKCAENKEDPLWADASKRLKDQIFGSHDAGWLSYYEYILEVLELDCCKPLKGLIDLAKVCGRWAPYDQVAILQHRHEELHLDEDGRIHNENGPAIKYRGGFVEVYGIHGVTVPKDIIMEPENITIERIKEEDNAEVRRIMTERYGMGRYLADIKASVIDIDTVAISRDTPSGGHITRALLKALDGTMYFVGTDGSTGRVYYMQVPTNCKTCVDAHNSLMGSAGSDSKIVIRS